MQFTTTTHAIRTSRHAASAERGRRTINRKAIALWTIQGLLAALFLFAGGFKLVAPADTLTDGSPFPALFFRFIGVCEVLGAAGLILPGVLRIRVGLTPLAAAGLVIIMIGAVVTTVITMSVGAAVFPLVVGMLAATIVRGRTQRVAPGSRFARARGRAAHARG